MAGDYKEPITHYPPLLQTAVMADRKLVDAIIGSIKQHPELDPLQRSEVVEIARVAFTAWQELNPIELDFENYLSDTPSVYGEIAIALGQNSLAGAAS